MKRGIITVTPQTLRHLLQIPEGAIIAGIRVPFDRPGILEIALEGAGWETFEGNSIRRAHDGTAREENGKLIIDWHLGE